MAFLPIFGTENLKNDKTCERPDFLFRKTIPCNMFEKKCIVGPPDWRFKYFFPLYIQTNGKMNIFFVFLAIFEVTYLKNHANGFD